MIIPASVERQVSQAAFDETVASLVATIQALQDEFHYGPRSHQEVYPELCLYTDLLVKFRSR